MKKEITLSFLLLLRFTSKLDNAMILPRAFSLSIVIAVLSLIFNSCNCVKVIRLMWVPIRDDVLIVRDLSSG